jgi:hypothetical protein
VIYETVADDAPLTQGDLIDDCPILERRQPAAGSGVGLVAEEVHVRVIVLTQACDLVQGKASRVVVAVVHTAEDLVADGALKAPVIRDQVRTHRVYGWYFLPAGPTLPESIVDLRDLHTVPTTLLQELAADGKRLCRVVTPYREHMAQHFSTTYSRIALPEPYETEP